MKLFHRARFEKNSWSALCRVGFMKWGAAVSCWLLVSGSAHALTVDEARHLLDRTGFGAAPHEIETLLPMGRDQAVQYILAGLKAPVDHPVSAPPSYLFQDISSDYMRRLGENFPDQVLKPLKVKRIPVSDEMDERLTQKGMVEMEQLRAWWLDQMISTRSPQAEKLALFWHNHFTSKYFDVLGPRLMYDQLQTIRKSGSENFGELLTAMLRDPAMLIFLDNATSGKRAINENLARELLELFTLGTGHYSQKDISELARALAGNSVDVGRTWRFLYRTDFVDHGNKVILGQSGAFKATDVPALLLAQDRVSVFLVEKLWREYVSPNPDPMQVKLLAQNFKSDGYEIKPLLRSLWSHSAFWDSAQRGALIKSPVDLLVGTIRSNQISMPDLWMVLRHAKVLGQELFEPPSVAGWPGGQEWIKARDLELRRKALEQLWIAKENEREWQSSTPTDLIVRLGGHVSSPDQNIRYRIKGDGQELKMGQLRHPMVSTSAVDVAIGITFETVVINKEMLPKSLKAVEIELLPNASGGVAVGSGLFVNWVELGGQRLSVHNAEPRWPASGACGNPGMMYCASSMVFDLNNQKSDRATAALEDRNLGKLKTEIDRATSRLPLALLPTGVARKMTDQTMMGHSDFDTLYKASPETWMSSMLSRPPLLMNGAGSTANLKQITLDPVYNLK